MRWRWIKGLVLGLAWSSAMAAAPEVDARLQAVLARAANGEAITVAAIGGSITTGYAANPPRERGWAAQVAAWLGRRTPLRFVSAGVSGTDSAVAVQRLQAHVLDARPDLVFVEFGVNDEWQDPAVRSASYEALLRRLLSAPRPPAVVTLHLTQQFNRPRGAVEQHLAIARRLGATAIDFGASVQSGWESMYDEPVHPNAHGHELIAQTVIAALERVAAAPPGVRPVVPAPQAGRDWEFTRLFEGDALQPYRNRGFVRGGVVHPEWAQLPGGQAPGWTTSADDAEASFLVWGTQVAVFHAESDQFRDLEAWVDDGPVVTLHGYSATRVGYLGWSHALVGRDLEPGAHLLHLRVKRDDGFAGSGRSAGLVSVMAAGLLPPALHPTAFDGVPSVGGRFFAADDARLGWAGRFERAAAPARVRLAWSGSELRARFTGSRLALRMAPARGGRAYFSVEVDGQRHVLAPQGQGTRDWVLRAPLGAGEHTLRLVKRTEAAMAETDLLGLVLAADGTLLPPPPPRPLAFTFYGDSITAGACNGDLGADQYEDLSTHDGTRAYGALAAARLGADYLGIAISGTGLTATWGEALMPQVWDRTAARPDAPALAHDEREPDVVFVNLGQNDHGFPASRQQRIAADFGARYLDFVRSLRARHPQARLVLLAGGMSAWREEPAIPQALADAVAKLRAEGDTHVWSYTFEAFAWTHPRIDVHARMADELVAYLQQQVLR